jgi:hypothetical protein
VIRTAANNLAFPHERSPGSYRGFCFEVSLSEVRRLPFVQS